MCYVEFGVIYFFTETCHLIAKCKKKTCQLCNGKIKVIQIPLVVLMITSKSNIMLYVEF